MRFNKILPIFILLFCFANIAAQQRKPTPKPRQIADTVNIYNEMLNDPTDDLMENHPADDIYNSVWTSEKLNPYLTPIDSLQDSVKIDCAEFHLPIGGYITSKFGPRRYRYHYGTDLKLQVGDSVRVAFGGKVRIVDYERRGYGHYVVVRHRNGFETVYAHLSKVLVELNQEVACGEVIALGGNTGRSTGPHLHFEFRYLGNAINPAEIINFDTGVLHDSVYVITKLKSFAYHREVKAMQSARYYTVRKGDNLGIIARRNGTSVNAICRINRIKATKTLRIGEKLRVR
ncbi:MAG: peptidoglycan DD-metalloendopeptidase family protein [Paludibacter sp.]|nr:peptidoglycan DD-metalloendopeptidase family protein [Paludibacter sp.]